MSESDDQKMIDDINKMTHMEMAMLWRFAPTGHPFFDHTLPYYAIFKKRYDEFGGMTPEISKKIGW